MGNSLVNDIAVDGIRSRAASGTATSQDCADLLEWIEENVEENDELQARIEELEEESEDAEKEELRLRREIKGKGTEIDKLDDEIIHLQGQIEKLKTGKD